MSRGVMIVTASIYVLAVTVANWTTARYGIVPVLPGLAATAGTYAAGAALLARDAVQDAAGRWGVLAAIAAGGALTALTSPTLAVASTVAFLLAECADMAVYTPLRHRGWARALLDSPPPVAVPGQLAVDDPRPVVAAGDPEPLFELPRPAGRIIR